MPAVISQTAAHGVVTPVSVRASSIVVTAHAPPSAPRNKSKKRKQRLISEMIRRSCGHDISAFGDELMRAAPGLIQRRKYRPIELFPSKLNGPERLDRNALANTM